MCQTELANLFSCLKSQVESHRPEYMAACAAEFHMSVVRKVTLATEIANSMVHSMHGNKGT